MEERLLGMIVPGIGLISGLIATYVSLQNRTLLAEVRRELAEMENHLIEKINGKYVRRAECILREELVHERLSSLMDELKNRTAAGG
jgi:hypothetical protein